MDELCWTDANARMQFPHSIAQEYELDLHHDCELTLPFHAAS